ncbi:MAG: PAS domain-containing protein [Trueperaceae bacterium]|nr:PAS domain-containing protein [Trueperaceae bacterium]
MGRNTEHTTDKQTSIERLVRVATGIVGASFAYLARNKGADWECLYALGSPAARFADVLLDVTSGTETASAHDITVVLDAAQDPRYAAHPHVDGAPFARFFVSVPLFDDARQLVGVLSLLGPQPRDDLPPGDLATLTDLAAVIATMLGEHPTTPALSPLEVPPAESPEASEQPATPLRLEPWFRELLDNIEDPVWIKDDEGRYLLVNRALAEALGTSAAAMLGRRDHDLDITRRERRDADVERVVRRDQEVLEQQQALCYELELGYGDRTQAYLVRKAPLEVGGVHGTIGIGRDITERKEAERDRDDQRHLLEAVIDAMPDIVVVANTRGEMTLFNATAERLVGLGKTDRPADAWPEHYGVFRPDGVTPFNRDDLPIVRALRGEQGRGLEQLLRNPNIPEGRLVSVDYTPVYNDRGEIWAALNVARDIGPQRRLEQERQALLEREQAARTESDRVTAQLADILASIPDPFFSLDRDWRFRYLNAPAERLVGRARAELLGQNFLDQFDDVRDTTFYHNIAAALRDDKPVGFEGFYEPLGRWLELHAFPSAQGVSVYCRDISERKAQEAALAASNERVKNILESVTDAFFSLDYNWRFSYVNETAEQTLGVVRDELLGKNIWDVFADAVGTEFFTAYQQVMTERVPTSFEAYYSTLDIWFSVNAYPSSEGISVFFRDVSERKRAELALRETNETLRSVYNGSGLMMGTVELRGDAFVHIFDNRRARAFFTPAAPDADEPVVLGADVRDHWRHAFRSARTSKEPQQFEYRHPQGERWLRVTVNHIDYSPHGHPRFSYVADDVTERKRASEALVVAKEEAERANAAKSEFLSRMSHELRTPLNAILGFAQLLELSSDLCEEDADAIQDILKAGQHLLSLIDEVLDIARIEAGRMDLSLEPVDVTDLAQQSLELIENQAAERAIDLHLQLSRRHFVQADSQRLRQVLLNLLSNAVKYNRPDGWVVISSEVHDQTLRLSVRDSGPGIDPASHRVIFDAFERLGAAQRGIDGTGIGLALSKQLTELMDGTIGVSSTPGQGSTFWLELPLTSDPTEHHAAADRATAATLSLSDRPQTLLYIEDNLPNLRLLERIVRRYSNLDLLSAMQGSLGFALAADQQPDVILLDLHLPDQNGSDLLDKLQRDPRTRDIPVIVVSADATPGRIRRLTEQGAYAYLTKPFDVPKLLGLLSDIFDDADDA